MTNRKYRAVLIAPDGDVTTDYRGSETVEAVELALADQGSKHYFFPFHAVVIDHGGSLTEKANLLRQKVQSAAWPFDGLEGRRLGTLVKRITALSEGEMQEILDS